MIKVFLNKDWSIAKYESIEFREVIIDAEVTDTIVVDKQTWEIVKYENSSQYKIT